MCKLDSIKYQEKLSIVLTALRSYKGRYINVDTVRCKIKEFTKKRQYSFTNNELKVILRFLTITKRVKIQHYKNLTIYSIKE